MDESTNSFPSTSQIQLQRQLITHHHHIYCAPILQHDNVNINFKFTQSLLPTIFKLIPPRQQPKHRTNGMDNNNTNNINRFAIINNEIDSRYSAKPDPTNDHMYIIIYIYRNTNI
eukprot:349863_1